MKDTVLCGYKTVYSWMHVQTHIPVMYSWRYVQMHIAVVYSWRYVQMHKAVVCSWRAIVFTTVSSTEGSVN